jgi:uncharacterized RDD family membrane protein YckC
VRSFNLYPEPAGFNGQALRAATRAGSADRTALESYNPTARADDRVQQEPSVQQIHAGELEYVGFWPRVGASLIDTVLVVMICWPLVTMIYGWHYWTSQAFIQGPADFLINWVLPAVAIVLFWVYRQATPGKIAIGARIVDAATGDKPSTGQLVGRYFGYYVSTIPLFAGLIWVAFDPRKQGWHDKLAGTVVVRASSKRQHPGAEQHQRDPAQATALHATRRKLFQQHEGGNARDP